MSVYEHPLQNLLIYRNLLQDSLLQKILVVLDGERCPALLAELHSALIAVAEERSLSGNIIQQYVLQLIAKDENIFSTTVQKSRGSIGSSLEQAVQHDIAVLQKFMATDFSRWLHDGLLANYQPTFAVEHAATTTLSAIFLTADLAPAAALQALSTYYVQAGYGDMPDFAAFRWTTDQGLTGIRHYDHIALDDLIGYVQQKAALVQNTEAFLAGRPANHVLLSGARGTGKSSAVKALANTYFSSGLRLVEVAKSELKSLPQLMQELRKYGQRFIIFLDDLSFEEFEIEYKYLKSVIEGGIETKPANVIIYATSNRRHLIKETWSDRSESIDEIHRTDAVNEKISLSDRFGLILSFLSPSQQEYLDIVFGLANKHQIALPADELRTAALRWEISHTGRSGRTAQQFITHILGTAN